MVTDFGPLTLPAPVSAVISDRQFFLQLALDGALKEVAIAAVVTGMDRAAPLQAAIDLLQPADQFAGRMFLQRATVFERQYTMTLTR